MKQELLGYGLGTLLAGLVIGLINNKIQIVPEYVVQGIFWIGAEMLVVKLWLVMAKELKKTWKELKEM